MIFKASHYKFHIIFNFSLLFKMTILSGKCITGAGVGSLNIPVIEVNPKDWIQWYTKLYLLFWSLKFVNWRLVFKVTFKTLIFSSFWVKNYKHFMIDHIDIFRRGINYHQNIFLSFTDLYNLSFGDEMAWDVSSSSSSQPSWKPYWVFGIALCLSQEMDSLKPLFKIFAIPLWGMQWV